MSDIEHVVALEVGGIRSIVLVVSKVEQVESELRKLSQAELRQIREWLDDIIEDELQFTPEFEHSIQQSEREMADNKSRRVREPRGS
jgi:translation initiation factor 2 gamma subunit (eIF-2gamma)